MAAQAPRTPIAFFGGLAELQRLVRERMFAIRARRRPVRIVLVHASLPPG